MRAQSTSRVLDKPLNEFLSRTGIMKKQLAKDVFVTAQTVTDWTGDKPKPVTADNAVRLSEAANDSTLAHWNQLLYQFCHEYCHHLIISDPNYSNRKWFEEIICEVSSRFFLKKLSVSNLKKRNYQIYKVNLKKYLMDNSEDVREIEWNLSDSLNVVDPYSTEITKRLMEDIDAPGRPLLSFAASQIEPIFERNPSLWRSVPLIRNFRATNSLKDNFVQWGNDSGDQAIRLIFDLFNSNSL